MSHANRRERGFRRLARAGGIALAIAIGPAMMGCASGPHGVPRMAEMDQVREGASGKEAAQLAPQAFAHADQERAAAKKAQADGDDLAAQVYADRAIAAYGHAFVLARMAKAARELADANAVLQAAGDQTQKLAASRAEVEREGIDLDRRVKIAREALLPATSGPADPAREAARVVAARALVTQARLLCSAARLVTSKDGDTAGLGEAEKDLATLETQLDTPKTAAPIDGAARARARCLDFLTHARRAGASSGEPDALLGELSASAGYDPSRDERGVVVTLRDAFAKGGTSLTAEADTKLKELGRVAAAHPGFGVQVVVHDASAPTKADADADSQRAEAAAKSLVAGGAVAAKLKAETAGNRAPIVDPADVAHRARNARLEVVFVSPN